MVAMISSGALPNVAFRKPPIPGPVWRARLSVASPISQERGISATQASTNNGRSPTTPSRSRTTTRRAAATSGARLERCSYGLDTGTRATPGLQPGRPGLPGSAGSGIPLPLLHPRLGSGAHQRRGTEESGSWVACLAIPAEQQAAGVASLARWRDPAGRLRSGHRRHRRVAGVWRLAGPLAPACRCGRPRLGSGRTCKCADAQPSSAYGRLAVSPDLATGVDGVPGNDHAEGSEGSEVTGLALAPDRVSTISTPWPAERTMITA